uniref:Uncharacterized protein n=1 Tax=Timema monikensis TaxID=170555 RepID=A0A7R9HQ83_9NEOP|nr:unnamed protein product [Timema monikensis]
MGFPVSAILRKETSSLSPKLTSRRTLSLGESGAEILGGGIMGAVEAALNTAQRTCHSSAAVRESGI